MLEVHDYQERFWKQLFQLKHDIEYLRLYSEDSVRKEKIVSAAIAILSSGSVAAWLLIGKIEILWATIIVVTQLVNAIRPYLPYQRRVKHTAEQATELEGLFLYAERRWPEVFERELENKEIHRLSMDIEQQRTQFERNHFRGDPLPENKKHHRNAKERSEAYFRTFYGGDATDD